MIDTMIKVILITVLLVCAVQDIRKKKILLWVIIAGAVLVSICLPFGIDFDILNCIAGVSVGAVVIIISLATAGKIGMGDALLLCLTGLALGFWSNLELFAIALLISAVVSISLLILHRADRKKSIPFVPFMLISYLFLIFS